MLSHKLIHRDQSLFNCGKCAKTFPSQKKLDNHHKSIHDDPENQIKCPFCEKICVKKH